jgi:uncharacterized membrane protein
VRWLHVITAIAWIGSSFYFIALDLGLRKAADLPKGAMARNGRSMAAASTISANIWSPPIACPSI